MTIFLLWPQAVWIYSSVIIIGSSECLILILSDHVTTAVRTDLRWTAKKRASCRIVIAYSFCLVYPFIVFFPYYPTHTAFYSSTSKVYRGGSQFHHLRQIPLGHHCLAQSPVPNSTLLSMERYRSARYLGCTKRQWNFWAGWFDPYLTHFSWILLTEIHCVFQSVPVALWDILCCQIDFHRNLQQLLNKWSQCVLWAAYYKPQQPIWCFSSFRIGWGLRSMVGPKGIAIFLCRTLKNLMLDIALMFADLTLQAA